MSCRKLFQFDLPLRTIFCDKTCYNLLIANQRLATLLLKLVQTRSVFAMRCHNGTIFTTTSCCTVESRQRAIIPLFMNMTLIIYHIILFFHCLSYCFHLRQLSSLQYKPTISVTSQLHSQSSPYNKIYVSFL